MRSSASLSLLHLKTCNNTLRFLIGVTALLHTLSCSSSSSASDGGTATCGDGVRSGSEQCDDGNQQNLDGCSATCMFEQGLRINSFQAQFSSDSACSNNAFGGAFGSFLQSGLQQNLDTSVANGSFTFLFETLGAFDLTGTTQSSVTMGLLSGTPQMPAGSPTYNGASDLDWWYAPATGAVDSNNTPKTQLTGSLTAHNLALGPGTVDFDLGFGAPFSLSNLVIKGALGNPNTPSESATGLPPGHLASEHLDPALQSFSTFGTSSSLATFCGNISALSLQAATLTASIIQSCTDYNDTNSLLDLFVGGCSIAILGNAINPTQPDQTDASQPPAGAGGPYKLIADSTSKKVTSCKDKTGATVPLTTCLTAAAYSSYFKFTADRVIVK